MNMSYLKQRNKRFLRHPHALYAKDVMFQHTNRLCGSMMKARTFLGAKRKLKEFNIKASVLPNSICTSLSNMKKKVTQISTFYDDVFQNIDYQVAKTTRKTVLQMSKGTHSTELF